MIIFLYGQDTYRSRKKLAEMKEKYGREIDQTGSSLAVIAGETAGFAEIRESASASSLFARKRMVVVENIFANKKADLFPALLDFLRAEAGRSADGSIIIFWDSLSGAEKDLTKSKKDLFAFLIQQKYAQAFAPLSNFQAEQWARQEAANRGGRISQRAASILIGLLGNDLWNVSNEIDKLISYKQAKTGKLFQLDQTIAIEAEDIEQIVKGNFDENIFAFTDALGAGNRSLAIRLLEEQINAGLTENYLFSMIVRQFRIILQIREALDAGHASRKIGLSLKLHSFVVQKGITQARRFSSASLRNIMSRLTEIDYLFKTGQRDLRSMLDLFTVNLAS